MYVQKPFFSSYLPLPPSLILFYLSFIGELEKAEGKVSLSPKQAGCLEETDFVVENYARSNLILPFLHKISPQLPP